MTSSRAGIFVLLFLNNEYVDDELIRFEAANVAEQMRARFPGSDEFEIGMRAREVAREQVIGRVLLVQAARRDQAPIPDEAISVALAHATGGSSDSGGCMLTRNPEAIRDEVVSRLRIERHLTNVTASTARPGTREVSDFYHRNKEAFFLPERIRAAHIVKNIDETFVVKGEAERSAFSAITRVKELLRAGGSFGELADQYSDCPGRGGDLGVFARGEMVGEFDAVVFGLTVGAVSAIFRTCFGFHIAKLYERRPARVRPLKEVRVEIEQELWGRRRDEAIRGYISELRLKAEITRA